MNRRFAKDMIGLVARTSDGVELGDVLDVELDLTSWTVTWLNIRLHRALTDRFHIDAPFVMGTRAISIQPSAIASVEGSVLLKNTLEETVVSAVVSYETDATNHLGRTR